MEKISVLSVWRRFANIVRMIFGVPAKNYDLVSDKNMIVGAKIYSRDGKVISDGNIVVGAIITDEVKAILKEKDTNHNGRR